jgi:hypothetical protein
MVYAWAQTIISSRAFVDEPSSLPFGLIFANFMCAMTFGSISFTYITKDGNSLSLSSHAVQLCLAASASSFLVTVITTNEVMRFWAFCIFEFCLGLYFPSMGYLKASIVRDDNRSTIYGLMRLPLNLFVAGCLRYIQAGTVILII